MRYRIKQEITVREIDSAEAYERILALRARAYAASGKAAPTTTYQETRALGDAKVLGFYHREQCVASFMVRFPADGARLESVDLALGHYPPTLPPKTDAIEVSKLCIHRDYRRTDLLKMLFEQVHRELVLAKRSSIVICCEPRLLGLYRAIGFRFTGHHFLKNGRRFEILVTTQKRFGLYGAHVGPIRWNLFLGEITREMLKRGELPPQAAPLLLWSIYGLFGPLAVVLENRKARTR